ncbi:MAG TPA: hemin-degrading factor, partial [Roseateles sp.]|nr:hemin-degrading factor [Roseateles sp.]
GLVSSLELFDAEGRTIAMLFGERKPGQAERCDWRALLDSLCGEATPC